MIAALDAQVRPLERADLSAVQAAWTELMAEGARADARFQATGPAAFRGWLQEQVFGCFHPFPPAWVAVTEGQVVGFLHGAVLPAPPFLDRPPTVRVIDLWVHSGHRRRGIGRGLVQAFARRAREAGFPWVEAGTLARDERAVAFWRSCGFTDWQVVLLQEPARAP